MISINIRGNLGSDIIEGLNIAAAVRGFEISDNGAAVNIVEGGEGYSVKGDKGEYTLTYGKKHELFRAVAMLCGLLENGEDKVDISGKSALEMCGVMLDCSRRAVPKTKTVKKLLARIAMMGMNTFMLYTEDVYELDDYPYFGYMRGRYTKEELLDISYHAKLFGIELIPCIQTLAHLRAALRWDYAAGMKENPDVLLIDEEKTYRFIESMIKFWRGVCDTDKIHIGMDEAHGVGLGEYLNRHGFCDRFELMTRHIGRVLEITGKYGFKPMMWSDMFFRIGSAKRDYYDSDVSFPEWLPGKIPGEMSLVYWDYYHENKSFYKAMMSNHKKLGAEIVFAGGAWVWRGLGPLYKKTFDTAFPALSACREEGIDKIFVTMWGDDGGEVNFNTMLPGIQLYAEYNYNDKVDKDTLDKNFRLCTGYDAEAFYAFDLDNMETNSETAVSKQILYQDVLCGLFDKNNSCFDLKTVYEKKLGALNSIEPQKGLETLLEYYKALTELLIKKCDIGINIRKAYEKDDKAALSEYARKLDEIYSAYEKYHAVLYTLWHETNKAFGFDRFEKRLGGVLIRLKTAQRKLTEYCRGEIPRIEELDEKLLWFGGEDRAGALLINSFYEEMHI